MNRVFVVVMLALGLAMPAAAQRTTGEIIGKVVDESGSVLPGVTVTLRGAGVAGAPTTVTSETGAYRFPVLPPGVYEVEYALAGFSTLKRDGIPIAVGSVIELDVKLTVGELNVSITVSGDAPVVNLSSSEVSTTYNREWVQNAPVRRYSYFDLINSAPGVSATSNVGQNLTSQSLGSSTNENSYQIDGTDISYVPWPNTDAIDEVEVLQLGASAEYGNVQGAVFNIVTRQGSNRFHGDANGYLQTDGMTSRNTTDAVDGGMPYHRDKYHDTTVQAAGPFIRDRLWFFGSLQYTTDWESQPGVDPNLPDITNARRVFWKFNWTINKNHRLMHGYHDDYFTIPELASEFTAPSALYHQHGDNPTPNVVYTGVLSDKTFFEARYSGFFWHGTFEPKEPGEPRVQPRFEDQDTGQITGGIAFFLDGRLWRHGFQAKLSHLTDKFLGGSHDLKVGIQTNTNGQDFLFGLNDTYSVYSVTHNPTTGISQLPHHRGAGSRWISGYADDTYRFGSASVNLGLRYDYSIARFPSFPVLDPNANQTGQMSPGNDDLYHWNVFSPRVGLNYRLTQSGKTALKAHYGRYYNALDITEFSPAAPSIQPIFAFDVDAAGNRTNIVQVASNSNLRINQNFKAPYSDQYTVQFEQEILTDLGMQVNYIHKSGQDYGGWQDIRGAYVQVPYSDNLGIDATGQTVMVHKLTTSAADRVFLLTNPDGMSMTYNGVTFTATKRTSHNWQGVVSLVVSKAEGRLASSARFTPSTAQSSLAGTFGLAAAGPNDFVNTDGLLIGDRPVIAKAQLVYLFPWSITVAGNLQHQTGRFYSRQVQVSGLGFPSPPTINMESNTGERRVPNVNLIDARVQKEFKLTSSNVRFAVLLDVLNLTNSDSSESVGSTLGTSSAFGVPIRYVVPRRLQLGAKIRW